MASFAGPVDRSRRIASEHRGRIVYDAGDRFEKVFLDPAMKDRYGVLTYDNWNIIDMCLTGDLNPSSFLTLNEKRAAAGYSPLPGGDEREIR